jgi:hypothetical protein
MKRFWLSIVWIFASCQTQPPAGCLSDKDCKGERICTNGSCVDPQPSPLPRVIETTKPKPEIKTAPEKPQVPSVQKPDFESFEGLDHWSFFRTTAGKEYNTRLKKLLGKDYKEYEYRTGVESPIEVARSSSGKYLVFWQCRPHECTSSSVVLLDIERDSLHVAMYGEAWHESKPYPRGVEQWDEIMSE